MMRIGSKGNDVQALQRRINELARRDPDVFRALQQAAPMPATSIGYTILTEDGIFGPATDRAVRIVQEWAGIKIDGIAGPDTLAALAVADPAPQQPHAALTSAAWARVARARSAARKGIRYKLSRGGWVPRSKLPGKPGEPTKDNDKGCDCSGFSAWVIGVVRGQHPQAPYWIESTQVYADATGPQRMFRRIPQPMPGCIAVYPDRNGSQGHMGIVTEVEPTLRGVDCSSSRSKAIGEAITERGFEFFRNNGAVFCVPVTDGAGGNG